MIVPQQEKVRPKRGIPRDLRHPRVEDTCVGLVQGEGLASGGPAGGGVWHAVVPMAVGSLGFGSWGEGRAGDREAC